MRVNQVGGWPQQHLPIGTLRPAFVYTKNGAGAGASTVAACDSERLDPTLGAFRFLAFAFLIRFRDSVTIKSVLTVTVSSRKASGIAIPERQARIN